MSHRIAIAMILSLLAIQIQAFIQIRTLSSPEYQLTGIRELSLAVRQASEAIINLPEAQREAHLSELSTSHITMTWSKGLGSPPGTYPVPSVTASLEATLNQELAGIARQVLIGDIFLSFRFPLRPASVRLAPGDLSERLETKAIGENDPDRLVPTGLRLAVQLQDGSWLNLNYSPLVDTALGTFLPGAPLFAGGLMIAVVSILLARRLVAPLERLITAAKQVGSTQTPTTVDKSGLYEFAAVADAFEELQHRLLRVVEHRTRTLAAISHDLRSSLTRMQLVAQQHGSDESRKLLSKEIEEMSGMLESILTFASGDTQAAPFQTTDVAAMLISLTDEANDAGSVCRYHGPNHIEISANPISLRRAFRNIIDNATKYGAEADVTLQVLEGSIGVEVSDKGPGIPAERMNDALQPFERLNDARSNIIPGTGLGLTIAHDSIVNNGGTLTLSNRPSGGLVVRVVLPIERAG